MGRTLVWKERRRDAKRNRGVSELTAGCLQPRRDLAHPSKGILNISALRGDVDHDGLVIQPWLIGFRMEPTQRGEEGADLSRVSASKPSITEQKRK